MSGFTLPQNISDLYIDIGGSLDFSMIVYEDDNEGDSNSIN